MNHDEVTEIISNIIDIKDDYDTFFWVNTDGVFHNSPNPNPKDELISCCGISYKKETDEWIITPWIYNMDIPGIYKSSHNARAMAFFWLNWITHLYGDSDSHGKCEEPDFEADWLAIKSNRSVVMMLFNMEASKFRDELYAKDQPAKMKLTYITGNTYEGDFFNNDCHGKGKFTFTNGDVYEGDFKNGEFIGTGKYTYANGDIYEGEFAYNKYTHEGDKHGKGKLTLINGEVIEGNWKNGEFIGDEEP